MVPATIVGSSALEVQVPANMEPGYVRLVHGRLRGNAVPINFVP